MWEFSTTDGVSQFGGTLATDGTYTDTLGTGSMKFNVTAFNSFNVDGIDVTGDFARLPSIPASSHDFFNWDRGSQTVTGLENTGALFAHAGSATSDPYVFLKFPGIGNDAINSALVDKDDFPNDPSIFLNPTSTTLTPISPVPEVEEYAGVMLLSISAFVFWRRRQLGQRTQALT